MTVSLSSIGHVTVSLSSMHVCAMCVHGCTLMLAGLQECINHVAPVLSSVLLTVYDTAVWYYRFRHVYVYMW